MSAIAEALARYRREPSPPEGVSSNPFKLMSAVQAPAAVEEVEAAWRGHELPSDAVDLWRRVARVVCSRTLTMGSGASPCWRRRPVRLAQRKSVERGPWSSGPTTSCLESFSATRSCWFLRRRNQAGGGS
jgi:hypothetical protein